MTASASLNIERRPVGEQVTDHIRRLILSGELPPGSRLVGKHLAEDPGISRTPVREALHRLAQENLVVRRDSGGFEVRPLSAKEVEEVVGVRAALESYAMERAARRISPQVLESLRRNVEEYAQALKDKKTLRLVKLNTAFHEALYEAAGSRVLRGQINELAEILHRFRVALLGEPDVAARSLKDHRLLLEALGKGDPRRAGRICREHVLAGGEWIVARLQEQQQEDDQA
ncbi:MAG: GntR family transcriptional regulator [Pseudomonadota bacterium]